VGKQQVFQAIEYPLRLAPQLAAIPIGSTYW